MKQRFKIDIRRLFTVISIFIALFSLIVIGVELHETKKARMLNNLIVLNQQMYPVANINAIFESLNKSEKLLRSNGGKFSQVEIDNFLGYFEMIGIIEDRGYLDLEMIDDMFGYDILVIKNNEELRKYIDSDPQANWPFLKHITERIEPIL